MTFKWKESFSVNVEEMDRQHQKFITLVTELNEVAEKQNIDDIQFRELFQELANYAATHFREEEDLLASIDYLGLDQQKKHHAFFMEELNRLNEKFCQGDKPAVRGMVDFLRDWLFSHVLMEDQRYAAAFPQKPPRTSLSEAKTKE